MVMYLLILHGLLAVVLLGGITHQAMAVAWPSRSKAGIVSSFRAVNASVYTKANIILYLADQFRWDFVGANGRNSSTRTPNLDTLAANGKNFTQTVTNQPVRSSNSTSAASRSSRDRPPGSAQCYGHRRVARRAQWRRRRERPRPHRAAAGVLLLPDPEGGGRGNALDPKRS